MRRTPRKTAATLIAFGTSAVIFVVASAWEADESDYTWDSLFYRVWFVLILFGVPAAVAGVCLFIHGLANGWWFAVPLAFQLLFPAAMTTGNIGAWLLLIAVAIAAAIGVRFLTRPKPDTTSQQE